MLGVAGGESEGGEFFVSAGDQRGFCRLPSVYDGPGEKAIPGEAFTERERSVGLGTGEAKTLWKLDRLVKGHKVFFTALADFVLGDTGCSSSLETMTSNG